MLYFGSATETKEAGTCASCDLAAPERDSYRIGFWARGVDCDGQERLECPSCIGKTNGHEAEVSLVSK